MMRIGALLALYINSYCFVNIYCTDNVLLFIYRSTHLTCTSSTGALFASRAMLHHDARIHERAVSIEFLQIIVDDE